MTVTSTTLPPATLALRPKAAARAISMSERTLWQRTKDGEIPCVRIGDGKRQMVLYPVAALNEWLARHTTSLTNATGNVPTKTADA